MLSQCESSEPTDVYEIILTTLRQFAGTSLA